MSRISAMLDQLMSDIKADFPAFRAVDMHPGRLNVQALKSIAVKAPALRVCVLQLPPTKDANTRGDYDITAKMAAFVITSGRDSHEKGLDLTEALCTWLPFKVFGPYAKALRPQTISAQNLYGGELEQQNVALWAVTWDQTITLTSLRN